MCTWQVINFFYILIANIWDKVASQIWIISVLFWIISVLLMFTYWAWVAKYLWVVCAINIINYFCLLMAFGLDLSQNVLCLWLSRNFVKASKPLKYRCKCQKRNLINNDIRAGFEIGLTCLRRWLNHTVLILASYNWQ